MPASRLCAATRAFVVVLLFLARRYALVLQVNRDSSPERLVKAYRKVLLKVHPDKGGSKEDTQKLQAAKEEWEKACKDSSRQPGRPNKDSSGQAGGPNTGA